MRWDICGCAVAFLLGTASRICSKRYVYFSLVTSFFPSVPLNSKLCIHSIVLTQYVAYAYVDVGFSR